MGEWKTVRDLISSFCNEYESSKRGMVKSWGVGVQCGVFYPNSGYATNEAARCSAVTGEVVVFQS